MRAMTLLPALLTVAACSTPVTPPGAEPVAVPASGDDRQCNAAAAQSHVGKQPTAAVVESARRDAGAKTVRTIPHDHMVTMEYLEGRLNIYLDAAGRIARIACG